MQESRSPVPGSRVLQLPQNAGTQHGIPLMVSMVDSSKRNDTHSGESVCVMVTVLFTHNNLWNTKKFRRHKYKRLGEQALLRPYVNLNWAYVYGFDSDIGNPMSRTCVCRQVSETVVKFSSETIASGPWPDRQPCLLSTATGIPVGVCQDFYSV